MQAVTITQITPFELETLIEQSVKKVLNLNPQDSNVRDNPELLGVNQLSEMIGLSISTIYGYTQRNEIPFSKKGKKLFFLRFEILEWIKTGRVKTISEIEAEADSDLSNLQKN
jgi:predicted DNA-binding transcriptional regulator AlpA